MYLNKCVRIIDKFLRHKFEYRFDEDRKAFVFDLGLGGEIGMMGIIIGVQMTKVVKYSCNRGANKLNNLFLHK